ncbi:MAG TPA: hypothetical protein VGG99_04525 [Acetobacteraceae bacterium]
MPGRDHGVPRSRIELVKSLPKSAFPALNAGERVYLEEWQRTVWLHGIDALEDLTQRSWPCAVADTIIGVFRNGQSQAAWLVVGQDGQWAVASCEGGDVSQPLDSLADALSLVCCIDVEPELET